MLVIADPLVTKYLGKGTPFMHELFGTTFQHLTLIFHHSPMIFPSFSIEFSIILKIFTFGSRLARDSECTRAGWLHRHPLRRMDIWREDAGCDSASLFAQFDYFPPAFCTLRAHFSLTLGDRVAGNRRPHQGAA